MLQNLLVVFTVTFTIGVCLYAILKGAKPERSSGLVFLTGFFIFNAFVLFGWENSLWPYLLIDALCWIYFFNLCWKSVHPWPICACAGQSVSLMVHIAAALQPLIPYWVQMSALNLSGYVILTALLVGTLASRQRSVKAAGD
jgi:hypothetical protein